MVWAGNKGSPLLPLAAATQVCSTRVDLDGVGGIEAFPEGSLPCVSLQVHPRPPRKRVFALTANVMSEIIKLPFQKASHEQKLQMRAIISRHSRFGKSRVLSYQNGKSKC